jgi:lipopolysaccharide/colanic/teichoic acid biosynthesis glycosyltransferase
MRFPASRATFRIRYSAFDVVWAALSAPLALYLRAADFGPWSQFNGTELFCLAAFVASLVSFLMFRLRDGIAHHFSVHDALEVGKAVVVTELLTTLMMFGAVRLEGIPRSTPVIHALILGTGLILYRVLGRMRHEVAPQRVEPSQVTPEQIIMIGSTRLTSLYMRMMKTYAPGQFKIVAILDDDPRNFGKSVDGVRVVGATEHLESIAREFAEHGIVVNRILIGGDRDMLAQGELDAIERACVDLNVSLQDIPSLVGLNRSQQIASEVAPAQAAAAPAIDFELPAYFRFKRVADVVVGALALVILFPLIALVACTVLLDVGSPILFWQQRIGIGGKPFLLHKFRTLKPLFNDRGLPIGTSDRMSWAGAFIRKTRLDELPQLLNVLVGDMSLVGPRPLLPQDQPPNPSVRLSVKPGLTGWAQVNGGKSLSAEKKNEYDEWYIHNASLPLDLRILWLTFGFIMKGETPTATPTSQEVSDNESLNARI